MILSCGKAFRKITVPLLLLSLLISLCMTGCGGTQEAAEMEPTEIEITENESEDTESTVAETEGAKEEEPKAVEATGDNDNVPTDVVLLDQDGVLVEFRGIEEDSSNSWIISLYIENNREDEIDVDLLNLQVNHYKMSYANGISSLSPGEKYLSVPNYDVILSVDDLQSCGITNIENISFDINVSPTGDWETLICEKPVSIDMSKSIPVSSNGSFLDDRPGQVLLDSDDILIEYLGIYEDSSNSWIINLYIENNRDEPIDVDLNNMQVNHFKMSYANGISKIPARGKYISAPNYDVILGVDDLQTYGITTIENISFDIEVSPADDWQTVICESSASVDLSKEVPQE